jgi:aminoglycoside phosphotransferase (APT) family kinase protein
MANPSEAASDMSLSAPLLARGNFADVFAWGDDQILKLFHETGTSIQADQEAAHARAARAAGIPTPAIIGTVSIENRTGVIFERVHGPTMLEALSIRPAETIALAHQFAVLHADLHARAAGNLPAQHQVLCAQITQTRGLDKATQETALAALTAFPEGIAFCHGDFHPLNIILTPSGPVILDWFKATRGNPDADVARTLMLLQMANLPHFVNEAARGTVEALRASFTAEYCRRYAELRPYSSEEVQAWMLPLAAARLAGSISAEERRLLSALVRVVIDRTLPWPGAGRRS